MIHCYLDVPDDSRHSRSVDPRVFNFLNVARNWDCNLIKRFYVLNCSEIEKNVQLINLNRSSLLWRLLGYFCKYGNYTVTSSKFTMKHRS